MRSLLDFFHKKEAFKELDCPVFNPLDLNFNKIVEINTLAYMGKEWRVCAIEEYKRELEGQAFFFTDYTLINTKEKADLIKMRVYDDKDVCTILNRFDNRAYNPDLHDVLKDTAKNGIFKITDDFDVESEFFRINDIREPWRTLVTKIEDSDGDRKFTKDDKVLTAEIEYWDFWRSVDIHPLPILGEKHTEYFFCEMNLDSGWFTFWRGFDTDPQLILII